MTDEIERHCPQCGRKLAPHPGEHKREFERRKHCNRRCSTLATKEIWHRSIQRMRKPRLS